MGLARAKVRLFVDAPLGQAQSVALSPGQAHYLISVMRMAVGAEVALFNGRDGEWTATLTEATRKQVVATCGGLAMAQVDPPDVWLVFAPVKKARTDFIVEKAVEMGVRRIVPVQTRYTNAERVRLDRLQAHAVEAAEQCGAVFVPDVVDPVKFERLLDAWPAERRIMFCDETAAGQTSSLAEDAGGTGWAVLIGPEGGFSEDEAARLRAMPGAEVVSLGPRILRADTAAVAALTLWQSRLGDWR
jgi:16S rRNA (uracil1498-N3)-methyltransferase